MKTAVVILNWNGRKMLQQYLPSVCKYSISDESTVYVADNGSTDDSVEFLKKEYPQVELVLFDQNHGYADGYNLAIAQIDAEYIVLLNSDVEVTENWLSPLVDYMDANPKIAACQSKILSYNDKTKFEYAGAAGGYMDSYGYPFCRGRIFGNVECDEGQYDENRRIFWASGAALFIRKEDYEKAGGLDSSFFAHMEEIDLCWRLNSRGRTIACVPESVVYHLGGGTLNMNHPRKTFLNFRNNLIMVYKNESDERLGRVLFVRWILDNVAALAFLLKGDVGNFKAVVQARREFHRLKSSYQAKRSENLSNQLVTDFDFNYKGSLVFSSFLFRKQKFSDLDL